MCRGCGANSSFQLDDEPTSLLNPLNPLNPSRSSFPRVTARRAAFAGRRGCGPTARESCLSVPLLDIVKHIFKYLYILVPSELQTLKADLFRALGHPARIRILELLSSREHTVQELQETLELDQPVVSQHLAALRARHLV